MVNVPHIEFEFLLPGNGVAAMALRPARDSGTYFVATRLLLAVQREILHEQRTWADEAHVAAEDVPKLRQFVD